MPSPVKHHCELIQVENLAEPKKTQANRAADNIESTVVAGVGFEPTTFRL